MLIGDDLSSNGMYFCPHDYCSNIDMRVLCFTAVRQYDSKEGRVVFTLHKVSEDKTCLNFRIIQENEVDQLKPANVKIHDFYRPEERNVQVTISLLSFSVSL